MIKKNIFDFLKELEKNNNREWFNENKHLYKAANDEIIKIIESLIQKISEFDIEIDFSSKIKVIYSFLFNI